VEWSGTQPDFTTIITDGNNATVTYVEL